MNFVDLEVNFSVNIRFASTLNTIDAIFTNLIMRS